MAQPEDSDEASEDERADAIFDAVREGFLVGLVRQLRAAYGDATTEQAEDAVAEAAKRLVARMKRPPRVDDIRAYLAKVAHNEIKQILKRAARLGEVALEDWDDTAESAESEALRDAAVEAIKAEIRTWENANIREVMLIVVDSIAFGEPLDHSEVAAVAGQNLGEEISVSSVSQWKSRGMRRLRETFADPDTR